MLCLIGTVALAAILHAGHTQLFRLAGKAQAAGILLGVGIHIGFELLKGAFQQGHIRLGCVVLVLHAGAAHHSTLRQLFEDGFGHFHLFAEGTLEVLQRDVARAEQGGLFAHHRHHSAFYAHVALAAVQNQRQAAVHIGEHILRVGGAGLAGKIGAGGSKGAAALFNDGAGHRVAGHPDAHGVQTGTALRCHLRAAGHNDGERAGAERSHQQLGALRHLADKAGQHFRSGDVDDQGIVLRAALGHKDLLHSLAVAGIGSNAVNRLGGQGHQLTVLQQGSGFFNALFVRCGQNFSFHFHTDHRSFYL